MAAPHPLLLPLINGEPLPEGSVVTIDVVRSAEEHGVAAFLDGIVTERGLSTDPPQVKQLLAMNVLETTHENQNAMIAIDHLQDAATSLGVEVAIFKGVAVGSRFHPNPELRRTIDVDAFVHPDHLNRMGDLATTLGATEHFGAAIDAMVAEGRVFEVPLPTNGTAVDLHRDPMNMVLPSVRERDRWDRTITVALPNGGKVRTLDLEDTVIQALLHLFRDNFADLLHVWDVRLMLDAEPDWDEVERRTAVDGWTDIVRYAAWFVADTFGMESPLPTSVTRWRRAVMEAVWPRNLLFQGARSVTRSDRRQSALSLLTAQRPAALAAAYARRVFPPRSVIELRSGRTGLSYPAALADWRMRQRRTLTAWKAEAGE
jgi:hypothetical protein